MSFAYDRVTGQAFRGSEFSIRARNRILKSSDADALFLSPDPRKDAEDLSFIGALIFWYSRKLGLRVVARIRHS
jgi:hypothetical protein